MTDEARRKILEKVAAGQMDPGDAPDALADLGAPSARPETEREPDRDPPVTRVAVGAGSHRVRLVRVDANFRPVEIIGDEGVQEAVAEGSHRIRREGDTLVID